MVLLTSSATKMFVHCLLIFLIVCLILRYYLSFVPSWSKLDLSKPVRLSDIDAVCANMKRLYQTNAGQRTESPKSKRKTSGRSLHSLEHRLVHLDLKGAPPKVNFYMELFRFFRHHNVTGLLIEYEDMFPYWGPLLGNAPAYNAYSVKEIKKIVDTAKANKLEIIPLIQTFGHLEFLLKHKSNIELREVPSYPNVICPTHNSTMKIIETMINQIVELHPGIKYLHIGCDEVYELAKCSRCQSVSYKKNWMPAQLFLHHVSKVARYVRRTYPKITPLIWEDHLRTMTADQIRMSNIPSLVEPVVWNYHPNVVDFITHETWITYSQVFKDLWIASAFKGSTAPDSILPNMKNHLDNHVAWARIIDTYSPFVNFRGIIMTGWQRYDHFATLCELLPVGIPSLVAALHYMQTYDSNETPKISDLVGSLQCDGPYPLQVQEIPYEGIHCNFPGSAVLKTVSQYSTIVEQVTAAKTPTLRGWLSPFHIRYNVSNPYLVIASTESLSRIKGDLEYIERAFQEASSPLFDKYTIDEWLAINTKPFLNWVNDLQEAKDKLLSTIDWPRRPFNIIGGD